MSARASDSKILTFYSYKGGTGRSMALANVAWILASNGKRVLMVDWDLEAPGLHRYFHPFLLDKELTASRGLIDLVWDFATEAMTPVNDPDEGRKGWHEEFAQIHRYAVAIRWPFGGEGRLDLVPAGRQGPAYAARVNSFNWQNFYDRLGGGVFLEAVKQKMRERYDYILIDSRTGVSDTSGICTVQMPDTLVVLFTANTQGIEGASAVAASVQERWDALAREDRSKAAAHTKKRIFPVLTRVELGEKDKLELAREYSRSKFDRYIEDLPSKEEYAGRVEMLYVPWYAYEEVLAPFGDKPKEGNSLLAASERLTSYLTGGHVRSLVAPSETDRVRVRDEFARGKTRPTKRYDVFVSYSLRDREWVREWLLPRLEAEGLRVCIDFRDFEVGLPSIVNMENAVEQSRKTLLVMTPEWVASEWEKLESLLSQTGDPSDVQRRLLPLMLKESQLPRRLRILTYADFTAPDRRDETMSRILMMLRSETAVSPSRETRDATEVARGGLEALSDLLATPESASVLASFRSVYEVAARQIEALAEYKTVHDFLHRLQFQCYNPLVSLARSFPDDEFAVEMLNECDVRLAELINELKSVFERSVEYGGEPRWVGMLVECKSQLQLALSQSDLKPLRRATALMGRVLAVEPSRVNQRLTAAYQNLPMAQLISGFKQVLDSIKSFSPAAAGTLKLQEGVESLESLNASLAALVNEHDGWQRVDVELRLIEDSLQTDLGEFASLWPFLSEVVGPLVSGRDEAWAESLRRDGEMLQSALDANDSQGARRYFRNYRARASRRFFQVDTELLELCRALQRSMEPVFGLLGIISS